MDYYFYTLQSENHYNSIYPPHKTPLHIFMPIQNYRYNFDKALSKGFSYKYIQFPFYIIANIFSLVNFLYANADIIVVTLNCFAQFCSIVSTGVRYCSTILCGRKPRSHHSKGNLHAGAGRTGAPSSGAYQYQWQEA